MRLLILSCSSRKLKTQLTIDALQLYTGVFFQILKKALDLPEIKENTRVIILSARYGVLLPNSQVEYYDLRLTKDRAAEIEKSVRLDLKSQLSENHFEDIFVNLGKDYLTLINGMNEFASAAYASGGIGRRCQQLKEWLYLPHSS